MNKILLLFAITMTCIGCDPGIETEVTDLDNLYSVNAFISPQDSVYKVYLYRGLAIGTVVNETIATVNGATVVLTDGTSSDTLHLNSLKNYYDAPRKNLAIEPSKTYHLLIDLPGGRKLSASCVIPPTPELPHVSGVRTNDDYNFDIEWSNPSHHRYFVVSAKSDGKYPYNSPFGVVLTNVDVQLDVRPLPSDSQQDFNSESGTVWRAYLAETAKLTALVTNVDNNMFHYYDTYEKYDNWLTNSSDQSGIPSFVEPKPVFSNINGGVGIFAAYNTKSVTIEIK